MRVVRTVRLGVAFRQLPVTVRTSCSKYEHDDLAYTDLGHCHLWLTDSVENHKECRFRIGSDRTTVTHSTRTRMQSNGHAVIKSSVAHEPIAVVGIGCTFPGRANSPRAFWQLLIEGKDA